MNSKPLKILIVDNSTLDVQRVLRELQNSGYSPDYAAVASEAELRQALTNQSWDVVISDHNLPDLDSLRALSILKEYKLDVPFIIVSGDIGEEVAVKAMKGGASDYVMKDHLICLIPAIEREIKELENRKKRLSVEESLRVDQQKYKIIAEHSFDLVAILDEDGTFNYVGPTFKRFLGLEIKDLLKTTFFNFIYQDDHLRLKNMFERSKQDQNHFTTEFQFKNHKCEWRILEGVFSWVFDDHDKNLRCVAVSRDMSDRKEIENRLIVSQKMDTIGHLAGGVAHDFNNHLSVIRSYIGLVIKDKSLSEQTKNDVEQIKKAAKRATNLTNQLLVFSRRKVSEPKELNLNEIVNDMQKMLVRLIGEDIRLHCELDSNIGIIKADQSQIEQVIMNLAVNARDAIKNGGTLEIKTKTEIVSDLDPIHTKIGVPVGSFVHLTVTDSGCGIPPSDINRIFEPFFTTKKGGKGTGLGLATIYGIIVNIGGYIFVSSKLGEGTSFEIYLPECGTKALSNRSGIENTDIEEKGSETILVVEDNYSVRRVLSRLLTKYGYKVFIACDPYEAIEIFNKNKKTIDLLLTDIVMPKMNGKQLAETLRAQREDVKVLFMTGYPDPDEYVDGLDQESLHILMKPVESKILSKKIREVLDSNLSI